jgi:lysozyme family protein
MALTFEATQKGYRALWDRATIAPRKLAMAHAAAAKIIAHRAIYEEIQAATGVPWFSIGALHYRESDCDFGTYLGNGQSLGRVTTIVPRGRGPFASFKDGAIDALVIQGFTKHAVDSIMRVLFDDEEYNGWGYTSHDENSPYIWAGTTIEQPGMYDWDGHYVADLQDPRCGVAAIIKAIAQQDAAVAAFCDPSKESPVGPHDPLPPQKPKPQPQPDPIIVQKEGHTMFDVTAAIKELNLGLDVAEKLAPFIASVQPAVGAGLIAFLKGIRAVEASLGLTPPAAGLFNTAAAEQATDHVTPGAPNSPALNG